MVTITDEDIKKERSLINNKIAEIKKELSNDINFIEDTEDKNNLQNYLKTLENISETDIKNLIIWKKENHKENEELHKFVEQDFILQMKNNMIPQEEELFSYNDKHPLYTLVNSNTQRKTSIRIDENVTKNIKNIGKLKTIKEADDLIKKIKASGLDILSTDTRVILYDKYKFYDFDMYYGHFNDVFLDEYDFIDYIKKDCRITKRMKAFEKLPSEIYLNNINQKKEKQYFLHTKNQKQESNMIVQENELQINELLKQAGWNYSFDEEENIASWKNSKTMQELIMDWNTHEYKYSELDNPGTWILDPSFDSDAAEKFIFDKISANEKQKKE